MTSIGPLSSFAGSGSMGDHAAAPASDASAPDVIGKVTTTVHTPAAAGSSDDQLPKPVTTEDKKSVKPTMSPAMKESMKLLQDMDAPYRATDQRWRQNLCRENSHKPADMTMHQLDLLRHKKGYVWCQRMEYGFPQRQRTQAHYDCKQFTNCLSRQLRHALYIFPYHSEDGCVFIDDLID